MANRKPGPGLRRRKHSEKHNKGAAQANQAPSRGSVTWRPPPRKYLARGPGYRVPTCHAIRAAHAHISSTRAEIFQNPAQAPAAAGFAGNPPGFGATANSPLHHLHAGAGSPNPRRGDQYDRRGPPQPGPRASWWSGSARVTKLGRRFQNSN